jgi:hypothetical protein
VLELIHSPSFPEIGALSKRESFLPNTVELDLEEIDQMLSPEFHTQLRELRAKMTGIPSGSTWVEAARVSEQSNPKPERQAMDCAVSP